VENPWITIWHLTCANQAASPIHSTYNDYTKIYKKFFVGGTSEVPLRA
jgi:hypothetical protein